MKRNPNEEMLEKTIDSGDFFAGGRLNPTQQREFVKFVKDFSVMLSQVRFIDMPTRTYQIDKMHLGEPITRGIGENQNALTDLMAPKFNQIALTATKTKSAWTITSEAVQDNIEEDMLEDSVLELATKRIATDMEQVAIQGDVSVIGTSPLAALLKTMDGWGKLSNGGHLVDVAGGNISKDIFSEIIRRMPEQYLQDPDLRFLMSRVIWLDWQDQVSNRETVAGDSALGGVTMSPFGIPVTVVPLIPSNLTIDVATATPAEVLADEFGPYEIVTGVNDKLVFAVDGGADVPITIPQGVYLPIEIASIINAVAGMSGTVWRDSGDGRLYGRSRATGVAHSIEVKTVALSAYAELGLTVALYPGADAGGSNPLNEGSYIWLTNPLNFIFGMLDQTRVFSEFNKDYDRIEVVIYNWIAAQIENFDSLVKAINVRRSA